MIRLFQHHGPFSLEYSGTGVHRKLMIDFFASESKYKLPVYFSLIPVSVTWKEDAFLDPWDRLDVYMFPPFTPIRWVIIEMMISGLLMIIVASLCHIGNGFQTSCPCWWLNHYNYPWYETSVYNHISINRLHVLKVSKNLCERKVLGQVATHLRKSSACVYQGTLSTFWHWCHGRNVI